MSQTSSTSGIIPNREKGGQPTTHVAASRDAVARWLSGIQVLTVGTSLVIKVASDALRTFGASIDNASPSAMQDHLEGRKYDVVLVDRIGGASPMQGTE